jgi:hypothetical protein
MSPALRGGSVPLPHSQERGTRCLLVRCLSQTFTMRIWVNLENDVGAPFMCTEQAHG